MDCLEKTVALTTIIGNIVVSLGALSLLTAALKYIINIITSKTFSLIDIGCDEIEEKYNDDGTFFANIKPINFVFYNKTNTVFHITRCELCFENSNEIIYKQEFVYNEMGYKFRHYEKNWNMGIAPKSTSIIKGNLLLKEQFSLPKVALLKLYRAKGKPLKYNIDMNYLGQLTNEQL